MANKHFIFKRKNSFKLWGHFKIFNITFFLDESAKYTI